MLTIPSLYGGKHLPFVSPRLQVSAHHEILPVSPSLSLNPEESGWVGAGYLYPWDVEGGREVRWLLL